MLMLFMPFVARADIASKAYVDDRDKIIIYGTANPTQDQESEWEDWSGGDGVLGAMRDIDDVAYTNLMNAIYGADSPTEQQLNDWGSLSDDNGVLGAIQGLDDEKADIGDLENAVGVAQSVHSGLLVTDSSGNVQVASEGFIQNQHISDSADIELGKLQFPEPAQACETKGCMLMYYDGKYVWEVVTRDTNESISTTGYVDATADNSYNAPSDAISARPGDSGGGEK